MDMEVAILEVISKELLRYSEVLFALIDSVLQNRSSQKAIRWYSPDALFSSRFENMELRGEKTAKTQNKRDYCPFLPGVSIRKLIQ
jgi:hypothetical protein